MNFFRLMIGTVVSAAFVLAAPAAHADHGKYGYQLFSKKAPYAEVRADLEDAIINRGYVIDYVGHVNNMLLRTSKAADSVTAAGAKSPYIHAEFLQFCPAKLTHDAVSMSPRNMANCPIAIYIYEASYKPGTVYVGFRTPITGPSRKMREVNDKIAHMLHKLVSEVADTEVVK